MKELLISSILNRANDIYKKAVIDQQVAEDRRYGKSEEIIAYTKANHENQDIRIQSAQVKAILQALVEEINDAR